MPNYVFTAEQRSEFRKAITASPVWDLYRTVNNVTASAMSVEDMLTAAAELGVNPADFGTERNAPKQPRKKNAAEIFRELQEALSDNDGISEARVLELIQINAPKTATVTIDLRTHEAPRHKEGVLLHNKAPLLMSAVSAGVNVMLVGPAGSGKTTAAEQTAEALGVSFYFTGAIDSPYKLTGFIDAQGRTVRTAFRESYEKGGVFLFDEMDASSPAAVLAFNAALSNGHMDFPDGVVKRNKSFYAIAACNTFGSGASRQYVGRTQQDSAALDRYATLVWDYDPALEAALIGLQAPDNAPKPQNIKPRDTGEVQSFARRWLDTVTQARKSIESHGIRHIVSPRASVMGVRLFAAGWDVADIKEAVLFKGLDTDSRLKINA